MRRVAVHLVALVVSVTSGATLVAASPRATATATAAAPSRTATAVSMIGDSLTAAGPREHASALAAAGWSDASISAVSSRGIRTKASNDPHTGLTAVDAIRREDGDTTAWIVALGTNDAGIHSTSRYAELIREQLDRIGTGHRVLWVDVYLPRRPARQAAWNAALEQVRQERPDQLVVFEWSELAADHPEWLTSDGVHYTATGTRQRAAAIAEATDALRTQASTWGRASLQRVSDGAPVDTTNGADAGAGYVPSTPQRVVDTRSSGARLRAGSTRVVDLSGRVPAGSVAAAVNLTVTGAGGAGHLEARACSAPASGTSVANVGGAAPVAAGTVVALDEIATFCVTSSVDADLVVDLSGAFVPGDGLGLTASTPRRRVDSRGDGDALTVGSVRRIDVDASGAEGAGTALIVKLAATGATASGHLTVWSCSSAQPATSALNVIAGGDAVSNVVHVTIVGSDDLCVASTVTTDVVVDELARYGPDGGSLLHVSAPTRVLDTRDGTGGWAGWVPAGSELDLAVASGPVTVIGTLTATAASTPGHLTAAPIGVRPASVSALDVAGDRASAGTLLVRTDATGRITLGAPTADGSDLVVDVVGWFG